MHSLSLYDHPQPLFWQASISLYGKHSFRVGAGVGFRGLGVRFGAGVGFGVNFFVGVGVGLGAFFGFIVGGGVVVSGTGAGVFGLGVGGGVGGAVGFAVGFLVGGGVVVSDCGLGVIDAGRHFFLSSHHRHIPDQSHLPFLFILEQKLLWHFAFPPVLLPFQLQATDTSHAFFVFLVTQIFPVSTQANSPVS